MWKIYCNTLLSRKESKVRSGYYKLGRPDLQIVRNCNYCYYYLLGAKYHSLYPGFTLMISRNLHNSPIIPVILSRTPRIREAKDLPKVTQQLWNWGSAPSLASAHCPQLFPTV